MKKRLICLTAAMLLMLCGCGQTPVTDTDSDKLQVVATIFPEYDWVREIVGDTDSVELTLLVDNGVDLHSFEPSVEDMVKVSSCDLFLYTGGVSDGWVEDALKESINPDQMVLNLTECLEEQVGELAVEDHDHGEACDHDHGADEHIWLSLRHGEMLVQEICFALSTLDETNKEAYEKNAAAYCDALHVLDTAYQETVADAPHKALVFGDRFPFFYLMEDYGLTYYAAFPGCSAETEASFETIRFLASKLDELSLPAILTMEKSDESIAKTIIENTAEKNQQILTLNSMQSVTFEEAEGGVTYLSLAEENLNVLRQALGA